MHSDLHPIIGFIKAAFELRGGERYADEGISQLQHALQTAALAVEVRASVTLTCAALLHDLGHIWNGNSMPASVEENLHDMHEEKAYQVLKTYFLVEVTEPVRLHVEAKRYLCTTDSGYMAQLSPTSVKSFHDQGGKMSVAELQEFEQNAYHRDALLLRRWDDQAKEPDKLVPGIETYLPMLQACILPDLQQK